MLKADPTDLTGGIVKLTTTVLATLSLLGALLVAVPAGAQTTDANLFEAPLSGGAEVPSVETAASGTATFAYDEETGELRYRLVTNGLQNVTQAHIHTGPPDDNGPVIAFLFGPVEDGVTRGGTLAHGTVTPDDLVATEGFDGTLDQLVTLLRGGGTYVNVHTTDHPAGEIRGQIAALEPGDEFSDDDGNFHEPNIDLIGAAGIARGADADTFLPKERVRRMQMASLLNRALDLPGASQDHFTDDDGSPHEDAINALAEAGITRGCAAERFCPHRPVTRDGMASFLARALGLRTDSTVDFFVDDGRNVHRRNIDRLAAAGITTGSTADRFHPRRLVLRDQLATFLARALGWADTAAPDAFELTLLHNNDGESALTPTQPEEGSEFGGAARFATVVDNLRSQAAQQTAGSLMLSSGDNYLAGPAFTASLENDEFYDAQVIEQIGYDALAIGNHDFDFGPDTLAAFIDEFQSPPPFVSANLDFSGEPSLQALVDDGTIAERTTLTVGGHDVGVVGATTPELPRISSPRGVEVINDVAGEVQQEIDALESAGVDTVVLISHLQGVDADLALAPNLSGLDIMIAGGGGELLANPDDELLPADEPRGENVTGPYPLWQVNQDGYEVPVVTTTGQYDYVGRLIAGVTALGQVGAVDPDSGPQRVFQQAPDSTVASIVDEVEAFEQQLSEQVVAESEVELNGVREDVRSMETNYGNLIADSALWQATELAPDFDLPEPDVALQNGGGIRQSTTPGPGDITALDTFDALPFGNLLGVVPDVPREQFKQILERTVAQHEDGGFAQIGGFELTWDLSAQAQELGEDGSITTAGERVRQVTLDDGTVVVEDGGVVAGDPVAIAINGFSGRGGDGYPFGGTEFTSVGVTNRQGLVNYMQDELGGTVTAADYPEGGEGRITQQ